MTIIGHPVGDISEHIVISDLYKPVNFVPGWYFIPNDAAHYQIISTDYDKNLEEIFEENGKTYIQGFTPIGINVSQKYFTYPSGVPITPLRLGSYFELNSDIDNPYLFVPYFDSNLYGEIVYLDPNEVLVEKSTSLLFIEKLLKGIVLQFKEKIISDTLTTLPLQEKIISLLNCDIRLIEKNRLRLSWGGEQVPSIEILRKSISDKEYGEPIAVIPFDVKEYIFDLDNNSYIFTVRGINGTGESNTEISIGVAGLTTMAADIDLGDFIKIFEIDMCITKTYEIEIQM